MSIMHIPEHQETKELLVMSDRTRQLIFLNEKHCTVGVIQEEIKVQGLVDNCITLTCTEG